MGNMISSGEDEIAEVVLYTYSKLTCWPCGNCRQMLSEFAKGSVLVHSISEHHEIETLTLAELLPESFSAKTME